MVTCLTEASRGNAWMSFQSRKLLLTSAALLLGLSGILCSAWVLYDDLPLGVGEQEFLDPDGFELVGEPDPQFGKPLTITLKAGPKRLHIRATTAPMSASAVKTAVIAIETVPSDFRGEIYWWRAGTRRPIIKSLPSPTNGQINVDLASLPDWSGRIIELGLLLSGEQGQTLILRNISFVPRSFVSRLRADLVDLTSPETWSQRSINSLESPRAGNGVVLTSVAVVALGFVLLFSTMLLLNAKTRPTGPVTLLASFVVIWLLLDVRWQTVLAHNLSQATEIYGGKSWEAKQAAAPDGTLYLYAETLKRSVLPDSPQRIFILHRSTGHNYARLRLQYHLLPHNIYNFGDELPTRYTRAGDYVVILGKVPGILFEEETLHLNVTGQPYVLAERVHESRLGTVFRIIRGAS